MASLCLCLFLQLGVHSLWPEKSKKNSLANAELGFLMNEQTPIWYREIQYTVCKVHLQPCACTICIVELFLYACTLHTAQLIHKKGGYFWSFFGAFLSTSFYTASSAALQIQLCWRMLGLKTLALTVRRSNHSARYHSHSGQHLILHKRVGHWRGEIRTEPHPPPHQVWWG